MNRPRWPGWVIAIAIVVVVGAGALAIFGDSLVTSQESHTEPAAQPTTAPSVDPL